MSISATLRNQVRQQADYLCEYCHSSEEASTSQFTLDHLQPRSRGGADELSNLALACHRCNTRRYNFITGEDPQTGQLSPLFNPRIQSWSEHFAWSRDGLRIEGQSSIGRATCQRLDLNDDDHDEGAIIKARRLWKRGGWHPPDSDPVLTDEGLTGLSYALSPKYRRSKATSGQAEGRSPMDPCLYRR